jgi:prepilin-type N-terminal cleavage/methylation domain-containing protein
MPVVKRNRKKMPKRGGFSLVEIMIVIVLVGLLVVMVGPPMYGYLQAHRLQTGTDRLVTDLQYARAQSISRGRILRINTTVNGYAITEPASGDTIRQQTLDQGVVLALAQQSNFFPWGMADNTNFNISNSTGAKQIDLLPTGIVEVQ